MKRIEIWALIGRDGRLSGPIAQAVRGVLQGHYAGRTVKIVVEGLESDISLGDRLFYRTQFLPMWLDSLRQEGRAVDPVSDRDIKWAHRFYCKEILGYEKVKDQKTGRWKDKARDAYGLSDWDFKRYLEDCIDLSEKIQNFNKAMWKQSAKEWKQNEQPTMDLYTVKYPFCVDSESRDNGGYRAQDEGGGQEQPGG